jgi:opine dehydrogenase
VLYDAIDGKGYLAKLTDDLAEAVAYAELIMVTTTADAHRELASRMAPYVRDGQIIILNPGRTLGAFEFSLILRRQVAKNVIVAEAQSLIYACRADFPGKVRVIGVKNNVLLAAFPHPETTFVLETINSVYPCFRKAGSVLETSLENIGAILHPAVILFNAATIERGEKFYFYSDMTFAVAGFIEALDKERLLIGNAFGLQLKPVSEWVSFAYNGIKGDNFLEKVKNNPAYYKIPAPTSLNCRMLLEDIPTGILPMVELGRYAGVQTPLMNSVLHISQTLLKRDFTTDGRTLANLGIDKMTLQEFTRQL